MVSLREEEEEEGEEEEEEQQQQEQDQEREQQQQQQQPESVLYAQSGHSLDTFFEAAFFYPSVLCLVFPGRIIFCLDQKFSPDLRGGGRKSRIGLGTLFVSGSSSKMCDVTSG